MANNKSAVRELPPDGGWGWMVAFGCFLILFMLPLLTMGFSILFYDFLIQQGASSVTIAWIFNIHGLLWNLMGPFSGPLTKEFGFRRISMCGGIMAAVCVFICAFSTSTTYLMVTFSLAGLFGGMTCKPCYLIIPVYFEKRRGMANALCMAGLCMGQFVGPPAIRYFLRQFGFVGATMIVSACILHTCIGASFFHPIQWHVKREICTVEQSSSPENISNTPNKTSEMNESESLIHERQLLERTLSHRDSILTHRAIALRASRQRQFSECSNISSVAASMVDLSSIPNIPAETNKSETIDNAKTPAEQKCLPIRVIYNLISDVGILRYHRAKIIAFGGLFLINGYLNFLMIAPFAIQAAGYSAEDAAWCVSITGICNFVARISSSMLSDYTWFHMKTMYVLGAVIVGLSTAAFSFVTTLTGMKIVMAFWSFGIGMNISLYALVMARVMGVENMPAIFGTQSLIVGVGYIAFGPLIGFIRDISGSYALSILIMSGEVWICVLLWCFMPYAIKRDAQIDLKKAEKEAGQEDTPA